MARSARKQWVLAWLSVVILVPMARAEDAVRPGLPPPVTSGGPAAAAAPGLAGPQTVAASPVGCSAGPASGATLLPPDDPHLMPPGQQPGWFLETDVGLVFPRLKGRLNSGSPPGPEIPDAVDLPFAPLDFDVLPTFEVGYHLAQGAGELRLAYRFLNAEGSDTATGLAGLGSGAFRSRLALNQAGLSYRTSEFLLDPTPDIRRQLWASLGLDVADVFFDTQAVGPAGSAAQASSNFVGLGPHAAFGWGRPLGWEPAVSLYARLDAAFFMGKTEQQFRATRTQETGEVLQESAGTGYQSDGVGLFGAAAGLACTPDALARRLRLSAGYHWERWWWVGNTDRNDAELTIQGLFLRGEWCY